MQALKTIVITLGAVLVAGIGLLIYGLTQNWHRLGDAAKPAGTRNWGEVALGGGPATVRAMTAIEGFLVVQIEEGAGDGVRTRLLVLDPATGVTVGAFVVPGVK